MLPKVTLTKALGNIPLIYRFCLKQDLHEIIDRICPPRSQSPSPCSIGQLISLMVTNRLIDPQPLYKFEEWVNKNGIDYYFPCNANFLNDDRIARELDQISPYWEQIQAEFVRHCVQKYQLDPSLLHYDITSIYFEGIYEESDFVTYGYSRDQKPDKKQVNLAVDMLDSEPFPIYWESLPGNISDNKTVIQNFKKLQNLFQCESFIYVGDRAMISEAIYKESLKLKYHLLVPLKDSKTTKELLRDIQLDHLTENIYEKGKKEIKYRLGEYQIPYLENSNLPPLRAIVVWSKAKNEAAQRSREKTIKKRREKLLKLKEKLNQPYYRKFSSIEKKIKRIMEDHPVNDGFQVNLSQNQRGLSLTVEEDEQVWEEMSAQEGFYILATTLPQEQYPTITVFELYKRQYLVEHGFKTLKTTLHIRPIFVHRQERIQGLVHITMLALCIYSLLEILLNRHQHNITGRRLFELLTGYILVQLLLPDQTLHFQIGPLSKSEEQLIRILDLSQTSQWLLNLLKHKYNFQNSSVSNHS